MTAPTKLRKEIEAYIQTWGRRESHGVIRRIIQPHPVYRHAPPAGGRPEKIRFAPVGWRVFLKSKSGEVRAVDAIRRSDGKYGFRFYAGQVATHWLNQLRTMEKHRRAAKEGYEARVLIIPALHLSLLWLAAHTSTKKDVFVRLDMADTTPKAQFASRKDLNERIRTSLSSSTEMWRAARDNSAP